VHDGFYSSYQAVQSAIITTVKLLIKLNPGLPVTVTGHSLGGALTIFCAVDLVHNKIVSANKTTVINFGQPRVGNLGFANFYNSKRIKTYRFVNQRDVVPHVPPKIFNFYHIAREFWFQRKTTAFVACDESGEDPNCSDSQVDISVFDHVTYCGFHSGDGNAHYCGHVPGSFRRSYKRAVID